MTASPTINTTVQPRQLGEAERMRQEAARLQAQLHAAVDRLDIAAGIALFRSLRSLEWRASREGVSLTTPEQEGV
jgi:hypothetical protein